MSNPGWGCGRIAGGLGVRSGYFFRVETACSECRRSNWPSSSSIWFEEGEALLFSHEEGLVAQVVGLAGFGVEVEKQDLVVFVESVGFALVDGAEVMQAGGRR